MAYGVVLAAAIALVDMRRGEAAAPPPLPARPMPVPAAAGAYTESDLAPLAHDDAWARTGPSPLALH